MQHDRTECRRDAAVTLVEYECPHCGRAHLVTKELERMHGDQLCFVFRNFPLTTG